MVEMRLYVEGGGDAKLLRTACRQGFSVFLNRAGLKGHMPRIVACGGRQQAYDDFCIALKHGAHAAMLLVDSEGPVSVSSPWIHLALRPGDRWRCPPNATDDDCHLMVQCMESWFLTDHHTLDAFFGQGFNPAVLPRPGTNIEGVAKSDVYRVLAAATHACKTKAPYGKGEHSFKLLTQIDPNKVTAGSRRADCFIKTLRSKMGC
jgi:Domain of unknown function (DUF4276)